MSIITSDLPATPETSPDIFYINSNPQILITCNKQYYDLSGNNYTVTVPNGNYLMDEYITAINQGISNANSNSKNTTNPNGVLSNISASINTEDLFTMKVNIEKLFDQSDFVYIG